MSAPELVICDKGGWAVCALCAREIGRQETAVMIADARTTTSDTARYEPRDVYLCEHCAFRVGRIMEGR